jgi:hypothetical protein
MSIDRLRYQQSQNQRAAVQPVLIAQPIATYQERDSTTGQRSLLAADGSQVVANYLSASEPQATPFYSPSSALGVPGFIANR